MIQRRNAKRRKTKATEARVTRAAVVMIAAQMTEAVETGSGMTGGITGATETVVPDHDPLHAATMTIETDAGRAPALDLDRRDATGNVLDINAENFYPEDC